MAKLTISEFLKRLTSTYWKRSYELALKGIRWFLLLTFIAVVIATLAECQPFDHYWQVVPDPGAQCRMGYAQLITMGTADMITDFLLIIFPVSLVALSPAFPIKRKLKLCFLFSLSAVLMIVTGLRIRSVINHNGRQQYRTVWASGEIVGAAAVANAIIIGSFLRDRGVKKRKYKYNSTTDSMETPTRRVTRNSHISSEESDDDAELFRDMWYRTEHSPEAPITPRPAPMAAVSPGTRRNSILKVPGSYFPKIEDQNARDSEESDVKTAIEPPSPFTKPPELMPVPASARRQRTVSFCDVGGLLEDASSQSSTLAPSSPKTGVRDFGARRGSEPFSSPPQARRGSNALLSGIGGFLSPILQGQKRNSDGDLQRQRSKDSNNTMEMTAAGALSPIHEPSASPIAPIQMRRHSSKSSLQDVGGLLGSPSNGAPPVPALPSAASTTLPPSSQPQPASRESSPSPFSSPTNLSRSNSPSR